MFFNAVDKQLLLLIDQLVLRPDVNGGIDLLNANGSFVWRELSKLSFYIPLIPPRTDMAKILHWQNKIREVF